ncbi:metallophosphoesterase family protein [Planctomycetota bacterium]
MGAPWGWSSRNLTLGVEQYRWLKKTLEASAATFKLVFIHHLAGGANKDGRCRGGAEAAPFFEWGGRDADGRDAFGEKRPGWAMPIHQLLVHSKVQVVFHGHDHFFAKQDLDGIVYQLVPQPGASERGRVRVAESYGYTHGDILSGPGHLRVRVSPRDLRVDYVRSRLPADERRRGRNREAGCSYTIRVRR